MENSGESWPTIVVHDGCYKLSIMSVTLLMESCGQYPPPHRNLIGSKGQGTIMDYQRHAWVRSCTTGVCVYIYTRIYVTVWVCPYMVVPANHPIIAGNIQRENHQFLGYITFEQNPYCCGFVNNVTPNRQIHLPTRTSSIICETPRGQVFDP